MRSIHDYQDVRSYLKDHFEHTKRRNPRWSLRAWARKLGLSSPSGIAMILRGERGIGAKLAESFADYFRFEGEERAHFLNLARLSHPANAPLISLFPIRPAAASAAPSSAVGREDELPFHWYFYAVREMTLLEGFEPDPEWIASRLGFPVRKEVLAATLSNLKARGFLAPDEQGRLRPSEGILAPVGERSANLATGFHQETLDLARAALAELPPEERGFFSSTLTIDRQRLGELKEAIRQFRAELEKRFEKNGGDSTIQVNTQLFIVARD